MTDNIYATGTVTVSAGSTTVTGSGTAWEIALVTGGILVVDGLSVPIVSVESDTALTLQRGWPGASGGGKTYAILMENSGAASAVTANRLLSEIVAKVYAGTWLQPTEQDAVGTLANRATFDGRDKGFIYIVTETPAVVTAYIKDSNTSGDWSDGKAIIVGSREMLSSDRTLYVRDDGNDGNRGWPNTAGGAFKTPQRAIDVAATWDLSIYDVYIAMASGTPFNIGTGLVARQCVGAGKIVLVGDETTPSNVPLVASGALTNLNGLLRAVSMSTVYHLRGVQLSASATGTIFGLLANMARIEFQKVDFGTGITQQIRAEDGGIAFGSGAYSISGGAGSHMVAVGSGIVRVQNKTITLTGTPAFTTFADATTSGTIFVSGNTFSGSATGTRFKAGSNGIVNSGGNSLTYLPGSIAGVEETGGRYV